jgi:hypothetical protein
MALETGSLRNSRSRGAGLAAGFSRRDWLKLAAFGVAGSSLSGWINMLADETAKHPARKRSCILLWMTGGPSQMDTFDLKPGHENGGPILEIETSVPGIRISEHLPKLAEQMEHLAIVRSMQTREGDHSRATYHLKTGYLPQGPVHYPTIGSALSKELGWDGAELPNFVSIAPNRLLNPAAFGPGFLGPKYAPLIVGNDRARRRGQDAAQGLRVKNLALPTGITIEQADARLALLREMENEFQDRHPGPAAKAHPTAYEQAVRMMRSEAVGAFNLDDEPDALREAYGRNAFGQGCLLARRLVERGVPFVEVSLSDLNGGNAIGWDTHQNNFDNVKNLCGILDPAWATLMNDLHLRGMLEDTLVVWMGEFGRTPKINPQYGRDHFQLAWSTVLGGGGIRGGQVIGKTSPDGMKVDDQPVAAPDFLATIIQALGVDPTKQNFSNVGRPIRLADPEAKLIKEVLV